MQRRMIPIWTPRLRVQVYRHSISFVVVNQALYYLKISVKKNKRESNHVGKSNIWENILQFRLDFYWMKMIKLWNQIWFVFFHTNSRSKDHFHALAENAIRLRENLTEHDLEAWFTYRSYGIKGNQGRYRAIPNLL